MILWHPRHRSSDGNPAYSERRASAWQYWHGIRNEPAWIRWLKNTGCLGAPRTVTTVVADPGRYAGCASERRYATSVRICWSPRYRSKGGIPGESPSAGPPWRTTFTRNSSGSGFINVPFVRSAGFVANAAADGPSPFAVSPWQTAQYCR